ncbi:hypothetical protein R1sor_019950 [Riccia sorocarpa]|uniref:RING-type E3 ubiquitin transferase n=1 Tax=Riccia sorocarpa TaxID=122646 RepID=A0ABD3IE25_9MARC
MQMPCETLDGPCMVCKVIPPAHRVLICDACGSGWHMNCLSPPLDTAPDGEWVCVDCEPGTFTPGSAPAAAADPSSVAPENGIVSQVRAIQGDSSLTDTEKARKIMQLHCPTAFQTTGNGGDEEDDDSNGGRASSSGKGKSNSADYLNDNLKCMICLNIVDRPVTTPCGHNSCLRCFQRVVSGKNNPNCPHCRAPIPASMRSQPRINSTLVIAVRLAALAAKSSSSSGRPQGPPKAYIPIANENRPDKCFTSERAVKTGKANAASGKIFVTVPPDHFGPIPAENDPDRGQGVLVGESWPDRMDCRQWGAHLPHVAGIAGQSTLGSQSVCLSGGYEDDEDHGEWFLYTGSGGRDLSGNKRTNKVQSFDQAFDKSNEALRVSCREGYPVRVVRSHKEKRSSYAPGEKCVRYDGCYRIEMCWRKKGVQGFKVCRYLFVRCDNEPAPWASDEHGDRPRPLPQIAELKAATDVYTRKKEAAWDWKEEEQIWGWTRNPPVSRAITGGKKDYSEKSAVKRSKSIQKKLLREFGCVLCRKVMQLPLSTPCGHNFCKECLLAKFAGSMDARERKAVGGRSLRTQKVRKACPTCQSDITDFVAAPQVNRQLEDVINSLQTSLDNEIKEENQMGHKESETTESEAREEESEMNEEESEEAAEEASKVEVDDVEDGTTAPSAAGQAEDSKGNPKKRRKVDFGAPVVEMSREEMNGDEDVDVLDEGTVKDQKAKTGSSLRKTNQENTKVLNGKSINDVVQDSEEDGEEEKENQKKGNKLPKSKPPRGRGRPRKGSNSTSSKDDHDQKKPAKSVISSLSPTKPIHA